MSLCRGHSLAPRVGQRSRWVWQAIISCRPAQVGITGRVIVWSGPAFTTGALFTVITTLSLPERRRHSQ